MSTSSPLPDLNDAADRSAIDASCRLPVLTFFATAILWLLIGTIFALLASVKLHNPQFVTELPPGVTWVLNQLYPAVPANIVDALNGSLTFGRVRPAHLNTVAYGWASTAAIGVGIWLMARLCRVQLRHPGFVTAAGVIWNLGVLLGTGAILFGESTGVEWLEYPPYATFLLFIAYAMISVWAVDMFVHRRPGHVYVSQWYIMAALFWFPWLYATANILIHHQEVQGSASAIINWWYGHNALGLWFTPIGLAAAYYFIPKVIGRPVHSYYLSAFGFWSLALFYSWNGGHHLIGGPLPAWVITASIVASVMMIIPVVVTAINHHMTMRGNFHVLEYSPTLRFVVFGAMSYTLASLQGSSMAIRSLNTVTHFTDYTIGHSHLGLYAFFTMIMFGSIYYIVPRLVGSEWRSATLIKIHFWSCAYGIVLMVLVLTVGGLMQGLMMRDASIGFDKIVENIAVYKVFRSVTGVLLTVGHVVFAFHFLLMILGMGRAVGGPTLFRHPAKP
ncbi:MAG: cbb3-type cytochrome c oxidase subunit I [Candidatus Methylacidiphilales bacterium]|nr:cbb3-type cytochrome c oxidase subunit I [Candidatus Methylacidiphilales bacterium]